MAAASMRTLFDLQTAAKLAITAGFVLPLLSAPAIGLEPSVLRLRDMLRTGHVDAARAQVESMIEASPADAPLLALLGDIVFRQSKFSDAEKAYRAAVEADWHYARAHWGLGRLEMLTSQRDAARKQISTAFQLDPHDPDIVLSYADFVQDPHARIVLLRNFLTLAGGHNEDRERVEDAAARLEITERLGHTDSARLASPYRPYRLKLAGYFPNGRAQSGLLIPVSLNGGKPLWLILDSGADGIFVSGDQARIAKVERLTADRIAGAGSARDDNAYIGVIRRVAMAGLKLEE